MKKIILLTTLSLLLFSLLTLNVYSSTALQQDKPATADDITRLERTINSLQGQLAKQKAMQQKQSQQNDNSISALKAIDAQQQASINDLKASLNSQQEELNKVPEAIAARSYLFGKKRILAVSLIILAFLVGAYYVLQLKKRVSTYIEDMKKMEEKLQYKLTQDNIQNREYLSKETADLRAMLERQTHENKNRIVALLADANQLVHKMGDEVNKATDEKIALLKHELGSGIAVLNERLSMLDSNKSL